MEEWKFCEYNNSVPRVYKRRGFYLNLWNIGTSWLDGIRIVNASHLEQETQ